MKFTKIISTFLIFTLVYTDRRKFLTSELDDDVDKARLRVNDNINCDVGIRDTRTGITEENYIIASQLQKLKATACHCTYNLLIMLVHNGQIVKVRTYFLNLFLKLRNLCTDFSIEKRIDHSDKFPEEKKELGVNLKAFDFQVAGNKGDKRGKTFGVCKDADGKVLKGSPTVMEQNFYLNLEKASDSDPVLKELQRFVPEFYGLRTIKTDEDKENTYLSLEDITRNFLLPSVMDVKIGEQTWAPTESEDKIKKRKAKFVEMRKHYGFCIPGARYSQFRSGKSEKLKRPYTDTMTPEQGITVLYKFANEMYGLRHGLVDRILEQLREIRSWFAHQDRYNFFGSSILIAYDTSSLKGNKPKVRVRMIDFSQAIPSTNRDENYARGLGNLIKVFENLGSAVRRYTNISLVKGMTREKWVTSDGKSFRNTSNHVWVPADFAQKFNVFANYSYFADRSKKALGLLFMILQSVNYQNQRVFYKPDIGMEENNFYKDMSMALDPVLVELKEFIPSYHGKLRIEAKGRVWNVLRLENFMNGLKLPCFTYLTIGSRSKPEWAPLKSDEDEFVISTIMEERNFEVREVRYHSGRTSWPRKNEGPIWWRASETNSIQPDKALHDFVNGDTGIKFGLVDSFLQKLRQLESWFRRQRFYRFYQSSLVLLYDATDLRNILYKAVDGRSSFNISVKVFLLDFDNTFVDTEDRPDENCLSALQNLISVFQNMSSRFPKSTETEILSNQS